MPLNFSGQNLQGRDFRGQDLTGADFSGADIRGADFTGAILRGANFKAARAGLQRHWVAIALLMAGFSGLFVGFVAAWIISFLTSDTHQDVITGAFSLAQLLIFLIVTWHKGFARAFGISLGSIASLATLAGGFSVAINQVYLGDLTIASATTGAVTVAAAFTFIVSLAITVTAASNSAIIIAFAGAAIGVFVIPLSATQSEVAINIAKVGVSGIALAGGTAAIFVLLCAYIARLALAESGNHRLIRELAIAGATITGTSFREADLTHANFAQAILKSTDLRNAALICSNFHQGKHLEQARVGNTILMDPKVRDLIVHHRGANKSYLGRNFKGANLAGVDLRGADLTEADISEATLEGAWLEQANLTKVQAIATNLQQARLTGACIEAWNIDSTTQLEEVVCDYLYLRHPQQERRPSSGIFAPGDFAALFQEIIHTLDLIFRNGIDQQAFNYSLHQLQVENEGMALTIRSLEKKPNGTVIVRVDVPETVDKAALHADFSHSYELALNAIAAQYQGLLQAKDDQLALYQQQQADWQVVLQLLKSQVADPSPNADPAVSSKVVVLQIGPGSLQTGFPVTLQISTDQQPALQFTQGRLAPVADLCRLYEQWRSTYRQCLKTSFRLDVPDTQITNVSRQDLFQDCYAMATRLEEHLNDWLNAAAFRPIKDRMLEQLAPTEPIQIVVQTADRHLRRLPFQLWDLLHRYPQAEIVLSLPDYERVEPVRSPHSDVNILAILGDSTGIDLQNDQALLTQLPQAAVTFLVEPHRQALNDHLWQQSWDILFFAGHSSTPGESDRGYLQINPQERLTITQLKHGLRKAIAQGLKLAIFNSCDGLGLARELSDLHIPHLIVMREPVPDYVAQEFLKNFLAGFSSGKSLHQSVRQAREKLQGLEDRFPCATWLPIICQNPTEPPLTWEHWQR